MHFDLYKRLGFEDNSPTPEEIKKAYRTKSKLCHPDLFPNDKSKEEEFLNLTEAYEILMDEEKRAEYDKSGIILNNQIEAQIMSMAIGNILQSIGNIVEGNPEHALDLADVKEIVLANVEANKRDLKSKINNRVSYISKIKKVNKNLKTKNPEDPIGKGIAMIVDAKNREILELNKHFKVLETMVSILDNYDYEYIRQLMAGEGYTRAAHTSNGFKNFSVKVSGI